MSDPRNEQIIIHGKKYTSKVSESEGSGGNNVFDNCVYLFFWQFSAHT